MLTTGDELLTDKQRTWRDMIRVASSFRPLPLLARPATRFRVRPRPSATLRHFT